MITNKCKYYTQQLTGYGYQSLYFRHPFVKMLQVLLMQYSAFSDNIYRGKKQKFSQKRASSFGNPPCSFVFARTYLKKIQSCMLDYLTYCVVFLKIAHLTDK
ncbi:hypothetical protein HKBW3S42_02135, partial [Candidatus Hakubella thermalkaliphila]